MKITLQQITEGEAELVIRYREMDAEIEAIMRLLESREEKLSGTMDGQGSRQFLFSPQDVLYFESVDGMTYAYLQEGVYRIRENLQEIIGRFGGQGFCRCARTMVVNIYKMDSLKSEPGGRILASLSNGEQIMISRKYAGELRNILRKGWKHA